MNLYRNLKANVLAIGHECGSMMPVEYDVGIDGHTTPNLVEPQLIEMVVNPQTLKILSSSASFALIAFSSSPSCLLR